MSKELLGALSSLEDKGIDKDDIIDTIKLALASAYKRNYDQAQNVEVEFNEKQGRMDVYAVKKVVENVEDPNLEIDLATAKENNKKYELGDDYKDKVTTKSFGRLAAQTAKQVIVQRMHQAERNHVYDKYHKYQNELVIGEIEHADDNFVHIALDDDVTAIMPKRDQITTETYQPQEKLKVYVTDVNRSSQGPQVVVSRTASGMLRSLFKQEVPEIDEGIVQIVSVAREAGHRAKIAVKSNNEDVEPVGTTVGSKGQRVQNVVNELGGESIDIVPWDTDVAQFIANALNPADVIDVIFNKASEDSADEQPSCVVIVPDDQLSLAIGKKGQNARLAAKLTGYKIDIESESDFKEKQAEKDSSESGESTNTTETKSDVEESNDKE